MKKNTTCRTWSGAFSDHVLFPTLGIDNCIFYARARSLPTPNTFPFGSFPGLFPSENETKFACFPALYTSCTSAHDIGVACVPTFNPLHVFLCTATVACFSATSLRVGEDPGNEVDSPALNDLQNHLQLSFCRWSCNAAYNCIRHCTTILASRLIFFTTLYDRLFRTVTTVFWSRTHLDNVRYGERAYLLSDNSLQIFSQLFW